MYIVDGHCDTLLALMGKKEGLNKNNLQINLESIKATNSDYLQFYAIFVSPSIKGEKAADTFNEMYDIFNRECKLNNINKVTKKEDLIFKGHSALLSVEGLYFLNGNYKELDNLYNKGVRCVSLTWNGDNEFSGGILGESNEGLSTLGKKLVKKANKLGILLDVSHITDKGFWDIYDISKAPFIATHSNSRAICGNMRNLDNTMLRAIEKKGGLAGINVYDAFLKNRGKAHIKDIVKHIEYIASVTSVDTVGFGTDFDGIPRDKSAIDSPKDILLVFEELAKLNYTQEQIEKVAGLNYMRVLNNVLK